MPVCCGLGSREWCSRQDRRGMGPLRPSRHQRPSPSHGDALDSTAPRGQKWCAMPAGGVMGPRPHQCPGPSCLENRRGATVDHKGSTFVWTGGNQPCELIQQWREMVAELGYAPNSPRLQWGAFTRLAFQPWKKWYLPKVTLLGLLRVEGAGRQIAPLVHFRSFGRRRFYRPLTGATPLLKWWTTGGTLPA